MDVTIEVVDRFSNFVDDWDYSQYLVIGGYGSGKSYHVAMKIVLKLLQEKRRVLVIRQVYDTIKESCYSLFKEILTNANLLFDGQNINRGKRVRAFHSPLSFVFPNGSEILFKGLDKPEKIKSINDISIVWIEEATEIKYDAYKELLGRVRARNTSLHFILSCNPIGRSNWIYQHFFQRLNDDGTNKIVLDENILYKRHEVVKNGVFYHHSICTDNPFLPQQYLDTLDELKNYDQYLYQIARKGVFGATGTRVLPQIEIATESLEPIVQKLGWANQYFGMDFGFEESYNAVVSMSIDPEKQYLYIWDEIYQNKITDDQFASTEKMLALKKHLIKLNSQGYNGIIVADNEDPKAIQYYRSQGYSMRACKNKFAGSRLSNTRKIKRFHKIIIAPHCVNTIRELKDLTYKKDARGNIIYDDFSIDPHTFSAIWYALDRIVIADLKERNYIRTIRKSNEY